jgi:hypothetical protein
VRWCALSDDPAAKVTGKAGVSRAVLRTLWKLRSGRALEEAVGGPSLSWYGASLDATVEETLTLRAWWHHRRRHAGCVGDGDEGDETTTGR